MAGFGLIWWLGVRSSPEPLFARLLKREFRAARLSTRLMLHELQHRVEELSTRLQRMELQMQGLEKKTQPPDLTAQGQGAGLQPGSEPLKGLERCREIYRLYQEGVAPPNIARQLRMGQGEVELVLSLDKKPSWVISAAEKRIKS